MLSKMWLLGKSSSSSSSNRTNKESLSEELINQVRQSSPGATLNYVLKNSLERLEKSERKIIVSIVGRPDGCSPLFTACKKGNIEIVQYLVEVCDADIEQIGTFEVHDDKTTHRVSPLWCSAVSGKLNIVKYLIKQGANVNSVSDTGSTPVRSACYMSHIDIVMYLVEHGKADILLANYNGGTCLINSVQSSTLCEYLLSHGADVNSQDIQLKTALHYAIQEHRFETTKLLLSHGADPFLKNRYGDDALITASLKGATTIFSYLLENVSGYSHTKQADMHELMGSTFLDEHHDIQMALYFWRKALEIRQGGLERCTEEKLTKALTYTPLYSKIIHQDGGESVIKEFSNSNELEALSTDLDQIRITSLLIAERILGKNHKDLIFRVMYRGAAFADMQDYRLCIRLWRYALQLRVQKDSLLYGDTCFTALALIRLYLDLERSLEMENDRRIQLLEVEDLLDTFSLLVNELPTAMQLAKIRPVFKRQTESFDRSLRCCTHLLFLLLKIDNKTREHNAMIKKLTTKMIRLGVTMSNNDSLLHLCVSKTNIVRSNFFVDDHQICVFPNQDVIKFLLECGANTNSINNNKSTPLHLVVGADPFDQEIVTMLLKAGAHLDQIDNLNQNPLEILRSKGFNFDKANIDHISLKCIAARSISISEIYPAPGDLPKELENFIEIHRAIKPNRREDNLTRNKGRKQTN